MVWRQRGCGEAWVMTRPEPAPAVSKGVGRGQITPRMSEARGWPDIILLSLRAPPPRRFPVPKLHAPSTARNVVASVRESGLRSPSLPSSRIRPAYARVLHCELMSSSSSCCARPRAEKVACGVGVSGLSRTHVSLNEVSAHMESHHCGTHWHQPQLGGASGAACPPHGANSRLHTGGATHLLVEWSSQPAKP
jgi:hypothetical protein